MRVRLAAAAAAAAMAARLGGGGVGRWEKVAVGKRRETMAEARRGEAEAGGRRVV